MNSRRPLSLFFIVCAASGAFGQAAAPTPATWTLTPAVVSQYMFRGVRLGGPSFEPAVEFDQGNVALGVWSNFPLQDKVPGQSDPEIDPYGSYKFVVNDAFSVQPGFTWYTYVNAEPNNGFYRTTFEPNLALNYTVGGVTLTPKLYYDVVLSGATYELNAAYALPVKEIGSELDFAATIGTYDWSKALARQTPDAKGRGDYWLVGVTLPYQVTRTSKVALGIAYTRGSNNYFEQAGSPRVPNMGAVGRGVVTLSYAVTF
jgi:uncharacterized protein (TIGR02001 family)